MDQGTLIEHFCLHFQFQNRLISKRKKAYVVLACDLMHFFKQYNQYVSNELRNETLISRIGERRRVMN